MDGGGILLLKRKCESQLNSQQTYDYIHTLLTLLTSTQQSEKIVGSSDAKDSIPMDSFVEVSSVSKYAPTISSQKYSRGRSISPQLKDSKVETWERSTISPLRRRRSPERQSKHHYGIL